MIWMGGFVELVVVVGVVDVVEVVEVVGTGCIADEYKWASHIHLAVSLVEEYEIPREG